MPAYEVVIKKAPAQLVASVRDTLPNYRDVGQLYGELFGFLGRNRVAPAGPPMAICHDQEYKEQNTDVETAIPIGKKIDGVGRVKVYELPAAETVASTIHQGDYSGFDQAYKAIMAWIEHNGYRITGSDREIYLKGPGDTNNPTQYITEIQFPVEKV